MREFYLRGSRVWVKVTRREDKSFVLETGYKGDARPFQTQRYPHEFMPTVADARALAKTKIADFT